ncbi:hypothetical protein A8B82_14865 [Sulfitobacter sp. EhC04]|uniref:hypothetical protein n=1 Tax=Sulfitobacter sp. EhC04 TaxID=1849168 RepID=UPI0007F327D5|nr:hypothetical protein [Sulfitobacter sp. EhC04]OAN76678.1 hypothetical protein A8B82_14865 [Sulfitobacter sp. EhC04]
MTPDMMTDNLSRAQDRLKAYEAACRKVLPLIEAAGLAFEGLDLEEVTDCADWDEAEDMIHAALGEERR